MEENIKMKKGRIIFISLWIIAAAKFACAVSVKEASSLEEAFIKVSKETGPAVVSVSTEHTERYKTVYYPFSQFEDEFFKDFFSDFFVSGPEREFKRVGLGSGVIIDKDGYVLTNEHVVYRADKITVTLPDGREFEGVVTGSDVYSDLAVVKINPKGEDLPFARLGDSGRIQTGQWAIAIGNPFGYAVKNPEPTVTVGVISALDRSLPRTDRRAREYTGLIQTDAAINPGNSGGPLLNIQGEVIGINVAILTLSGGSEGIGFAIPINTAKRIMKDLIEGRQVLYGWIGVVIQDVDSGLASYFGLQNKNGALISRIMEQGPAEKAGLKVGDIIVLFNGQKIKNTGDLVRDVLKKDIGEKVVIGFIRDRKTYSAELEIGIKPEDAKTTGLGEKVRPPQEGSRLVEGTKYWRGMGLSDITPDMASKLGLEPGSESGIVVISVEPLSPASDAGIRIGDVIYEINRIAVENVSKFQEVVQKVSGDALVKTYRGYVVIREK